jgi:hypothetical protein
MAKKSSNRTENLSHALAAKIAPNPLGRNASEGETGGKSVRPNALEAETAENALETLSLADFVELAELPAPIPDYFDDKGFPGGKRMLDTFAASRFGWLLEGLYFADEANKPESRYEAVNLGYAIAALRAFLQSAVTRPPEINIDLVATQRHRWTVGADGRLNSARTFDSLADRLMARFKGLVEGVEIERFRRCAYARCGRIFYAKKRDSRCCSGRCSNAVRQREWYKRHGKADVYRKGEKP